MKLMLITPGIDIPTSTYEDFGIPGTIVAEYLRENKIIPEKCDLNDILFLLTPAETEEKLHRLLEKLVQFETFIDQDAPMEKYCPRYTTPMKPITKAIPSENSARKCMISTKKET